VTGVQTCALPILRLWIQDRQVDSPLLRYIHEQFRPVYSTPGGVQILIRRDRKTFNIVDADGRQEKRLTF
jgi:hypothetical protein